MWGGTGRMGIVSPEADYTVVDGSRAGRDGVSVEDDKVCEIVHDGVGWSGSDGAYNFI